MRAASHLLGLDRQPRPLPCDPAPRQGPGLLPSRSTKLSRHPGACGFVLSGTVQDEGRVGVESSLAGQPHGIVGREAYGAPADLWNVAVAPLGEYVQDDDGLARAVEIAELLDGDALGH